MQRRGFLRSIIAGSGMILVPKLADHFQWKTRPSGVITLDAEYGAVYDYYLGGEIVIVGRYGDYRTVTVTAYNPSTRTMAVDWSHAPR